MSQKQRKIIRISSTLVIVAASFWLLTGLMMPKYDITIIEGTLIAEYYREVKEHDLIFIGDCEVYANFSPPVLWREFGINSFIRGSAQQLIWQSYYMLEDTLRHETPQVVVFNVMSLMYDEPQREAYNRMTLEGMRWSPVKMRAINASMMADEHMIEYLLPLLRYHDRWRELTLADFTHIWKTDTFSHNGFIINTEVRAAADVPAPRILANYTFGDKALSYLDQIADLCDTYGMQLVLVKAPSLYPHWHDQWEEQVVAYAVKRGLHYINYLELTEEIGIDFSLHTFDRGLHMNLAGAEILSRHLGEFLLKETTITDRRSDDNLTAIWEKKLNSYDTDVHNAYQALGKD
ncbi:MAG: SGNH/GDSL hydrolase family protein [Lachnospiraceae bacterium]|jgi:hypothetical protein|nr:SGNH/GDSL hydrolase family protein [Lachnospiraceae bacterium]